MQQLLTGGQPFISFRIVQEFVVNKLRAFEREIKPLMSKAGDHIKSIKYSGGHLNRHDQFPSEGIQKDVCQGKLDFRIQ